MIERVFSAEPPITVPNTVQIFYLKRAFLSFLLYLVFPIFHFLISATPPSAIPPAQTAAPPPSDGGLLVNVLDDPIFSGGLPEQVAPGLHAPLQSLTEGSEEGFAKFLTKNNGVLFENNVLQIGVKSEYKKNLGESGKEDEG